MSSCRPDRSDRDPVRLLGAPRLRPRREPGPTEPNDEGGGVFPCLNLLGEISVPEQHLESERIADLNDCVQHAERQSALIETEVDRLPTVRVILRFVAIQTLEIVVEIDALVDEPH